MNRRQLVVALIASPIVVPALVRAGRIPPVEFNANDWAAVRFGSEADAPIRSVSARVSRWPSEAAAETHRQTVIDGAGTDLPRGEFYQSEPVAHVLPPELSALTASAMGWDTTAGVAAYRTEWVLLAARRDAIVWDLWLSGAEPEPVLDLTVTLALDITGWAISDDLFDALPDENDVPDGMFLEERMSPNGIFDAQGTPIPMSERIGSR